MREKTKHSLVILIVVILLTLMLVGIFLVFRGSVHMGFIDTSFSASTDEISFAEKSGDLSQDNIRLALLGNLTLKILLGLAVVIIAIAFLVSVTRRKERKK